MKNKFYLVFFIALFSGFLSANGQDTSRCNAGFQTFISSNQVFFLASDSMSNIRHFWRFGDSTQAGPASSSINHVYSHPGIFTVTHIVRDATGSCYDSVFQVITINPDPGPLCGLSINYDAAAVYHHSYTFIAMPQLLGGMIDTIAWTINGVPAGMGDSLRNRTLENGTYNVCATMSTSLGCRVQSCLRVVVTDSVGQVPPPTDSIGQMPPPDSIGQVPPPDSIGQVPPPDSVAPQSFIASYPNPARTQANLVVNLDKAGVIEARVYNSMGIQVRSVTVNGYQGANQISLPIGNLPMGIYYVQLQYGTTVKRAKIQKI